MFFQTKYLHSRYSCQATSPWTSYRPAKKRTSTLSASLPTRRTIHSLWMWPTLAAQGRLEEAADRLQRPEPQRQGDGQDQVPRHAEGGDGVRGRGCQEVAAAVRLQ